MVTREKYSADKDGYTECGAFRPSLRPFKADASGRAAPDRTLKSRVTARDYHLVVTQMENAFNTVFSNNFEEFQ